MNVNSFLPTITNLLTLLSEKYDANIANRILNIYQWGSRFGRQWSNSVGCMALTLQFQITISYVWLVIIRKRKWITLTEKTSSTIHWQETTNRDIDKPYPVYEDDEVNATFIPLDHWRMMTRVHRHMACEAAFLEPKYVNYHILLILYRSCKS